MGGERFGIKLNHRGKISSRFMIENRKLSLTKLGRKCKYWKDRSFRDGTGRNAGRMQPLEHQDPVLCQSEEKGTTCSLPLDPHLYLTLHFHPSCFQSSKKQS